ncbi:Protein N-acetyltransferase, RimJ/RimL family [Shimia gijangensis]|uniref:Protein N-acetyltransferase, RimJ/RimL family n=1 Tax=Shimia gijangensis TaxID=1470563 RepID=A0A1M6KEI4_9RHOB|nr:GNAT family N-acetyltransferase [Shimia gijangensis]SHJ57360.1 Protein N-acetyltransferase, RimJ/RimL family [Shimia gijangensis]
MTATFTIPTLETERLILRAPREEDMASEIAFFQTEASHFVGGPKKPHETWRLMATVVGHWALRGFGFWALEAKDSGTYLGRVGLWYPHGWFEREVGWTLMPTATGKGYATEAAVAARVHAYDILGWDTAISQIDPVNEPSKGVARRLGARFEQMYDDPAYGQIEIWRHPAPDELENGGMEAYA